jgi:SAM-dependent methyltransferase
LAQQTAQIDPAHINGDVKLNREELEAYLNYHAERNRQNRRRAKELGVRTSPIPLDGFDVPSTASPTRVMVAAFFSYGARRIRQWFLDRPITVLDVGCGSGAAALPFLEAVGLRGRYIGLDIARHKAWDATTSTGFTRELVVADAHTFDELRLPEIDVMVSAAALEHIRDDVGVIQKLQSRLCRVSAQLHYVPGEGALPLYGTHGWRQYSPACLRELFPDGEILRAGGVCSSAVHLRTITRGGDQAFRFRHTAIYKHLRTASVIADRVLGNPSPSLYGVIVMPCSATASTKPELRQAG